MRTEPGDDLTRTRTFWIAKKPGEASAPAYVPARPQLWLAAAALGAALLLQSTLAPFLAFRGGTLSFVLLTVAWYGVRSGTLRGFTFGLIAGAGEDALTGSTGAAWTFATACAGALAGRLAGTWLADLELALVPGVALLGLARFALFAIGMKIEGHELGLPLAELHAVLWQAALDSLVAFVALRCLPTLARSDAHGR